MSSFPADGVPGGVAVIMVGDIDALHGEYAGRGVDAGDPPVDQTWGDREFCLRDPDGNQLRFQQPVEKRG